MNHPLVMNGISKQYASHSVVSDLHLTLHSSEILTLLGPSGCGKTTTLRLIAGLEQPDEGTLTIAGRDMKGVSPHKRGVGLVFQDYALFPHLNVLQNVMFGLGLLPAAERLTRARDMLSLVGLTIFEKRMPHELSGGQQQRVALARALAPCPALLLLDEPFSNLDARLRQVTRLEIKQILRETNTAALLVTHDQEEALALSDRIALMRNGKIEQIDTPKEVYCHPRTAFVAHFLGQSNLISGMRKGNTAETVFGIIPLEQAGPKGQVTLSIRPEQITLDSQGTAATIIAKQFTGRDTLYTLRLDQLSTDILALGPLDLAHGTRVGVSVHEAVHCIESE